MLAFIIKMLFLWITILTLLSSFHCLSRLFAVDICKKIWLCVHMASIISCNLCLLSRLDHLFTPSPHLHL